MNESMETLQSYVGSFYSSNFVRFGQMYKVLLQAAPEYRMNPEDLFSQYAKNKEGNMALRRAGQPSAKKDIESTSWC